MREDIRVEVLFNSVETELDRRHAVGEVPTVFANRPVDYLHRIVKSWWHIYHEALSATKGYDRTRWERNPAYPSTPLETAGLVESLKEIHALIYANLPALRQYRPGPEAEDISVVVLQRITDYYQQVQNLSEAPWKQIQ